MKSIAKKKSAGSFFETGKTIVYAILIALVVRTVAFEPFNIPSGSMIPTLLVGDYLFVSKFSFYRLMAGYSLPVRAAAVFRSDRRVPWPERGDVVVFWNPLATPAPADFIKRIVGLPGDKVQVIHGQVLINGQMVPRRQVDDYVYQDGGQVMLMHRSTSRACRAIPARRRWSTRSSRPATTVRSTTRRSTKYRPTITL